MTRHTDYVFHQISPKTCVEQAGNYHYTFQRLSCDIVMIEAFSL